MRDEQYELDLTRCLATNFATDQMGGMAFYRSVVPSIAFACPLSLMVAHCLPSNYVSTPTLIFVCGRHIAFCRQSKAVVLSTPPLALPRQRRQRFILNIRALDAWLQGHSYRRNCRRLVRQGAGCGPLLEGA